MGNVCETSLEYILGQRAIPLRYAFTKHRIDTLFFATVDPNAGISIQDFDAACDVCHFLLEPKRVDRLEAFARCGMNHGVTEPVKVPLHDMSFPDYLKEKRLRLRLGVRLVRNLRVFDWLGVLGSGDGVFDVVCVPLGEKLDYHLLGARFVQVLQPLLSGDTVVLRDPAKVEGSDASSRVEECVRRWLIFRLYQLGILEPST